MKIKQTSNGIERNDQISIDGINYFVKAVFSSDSGDLVEIEREGYSQADNLYPASECKAPVRGNGWCNRCQSYCWGDCTAHR